MEKSEAKEHGIPWGFLLVVKDQVSPWRTITNIVAPSQSTIPDTQAGDSIRPDIVFSTYPEDEISFHQGVGNSQKQDWEEFMTPGMFNDDCESIGGWMENDI